MWQPADRILLLAAISPSTYFILAYPYRSTISLSGRQ